MQSLDATGELLAADDATIDAAVLHADPMVLQGLLHQLTDDEAVELAHAGVDFAVVERNAAGVDAQAVVEWEAHRVPGTDAGGGRGDDPDHPGRQTPVFIAGGFGGATADVAVVLGLDPEDGLPPGRTVGPAPVRAPGHGGRDRLVAGSNGLTDDENHRLAITYRASEITSLVVTGLSRLDHPS